MNTQSKSSNHRHEANHSFFINLTVAIFAALTFATAAMAADSKLTQNNPYTILGHQLRSQLTVQAAEVEAFGTAAPMTVLPPTLFQEIVPCRLVSTFEADKYAAPWGPGPYQSNESRSYYATGVLVHGDFINPCTEQVPDGAIALSLRLSSRNSLENGMLWLSSGQAAGGRMPVLPFQQAAEAQDEANVLLHEGRFAITADAPTHLQIDVIGYFVPDPNGYGAKGDRGEKGETGDKGDRGESGAQGLQGEKGDKGDRGEAGAQGLQGEKGDKGDRGETGAQGFKGDKGDKGDRGEDGAQGLKGDKGDKGDRGETGAQGLKGDKGDKGDRGETGAQGLKGDKGDKGDRGESGAQGLKGDKGDKGDRGEAGAQGGVGPQGAKGDKGDKGDRGEAGAQGAVGPQGPKGDMGPVGPQGVQGTAGIEMIVGTRTFPPPGSITIHEPSVTSNSVIILIYTEVSNGNALGVASQRNGSFVASGSPNKPFKYIILNAR